MESMKGRWKRLSENANKWIAAYKEAYRRKRSGMILRKNQNYYDPTEFFMDNPTNDDQRFQYSTERIASLSTYMINREQLRNREAHTALKNDLIEHIWQKFGAQN
ncbi:hypothetical protein ACS0TY_009122 [Phlomoides rotata]